MALSQSEYSVASIRGQRAALMDSFRGSRFRHTPHYPDAPVPINPVPPVVKTAQLPVSTSPPTLQSRFSKASAKVPIWQSIQYMDHEGIDILRRPAEDGAVEKWQAYLDRTKVS